MRMDTDFVLAGAVTLPVGDSSRSLSCEDRRSTINVTGANYQDVLDLEQCVSIQRHRCVYLTDCEYQRDWLGPPCSDVNKAINLFFNCLPGEVTVRIFFSFANL